MSSDFSEEQKKKKERKDLSVENCGVYWEKREAKRDPPSVYEKANEWRFSACIRIKIYRELDLDREISYLTVESEDGGEVCGSG